MEREPEEFQSLNEARRRVNVRTFKRKRELIPPWNMPSDPVKALFWFIHWLLKVLVRFFWILILAGVIYETIRNSMVGGIGSGLIAGVVTLLVGLGVWAGLAVVLLLFNIGSSISNTFAQVRRMQQGFPPRQSPYWFTEPESDDKIVEGTVTDLEEERRKRRRE